MISYASACAIGRIQVLLLASLRILSRGPIRTDGPPMDHGGQQVFFVVGYPNSLTNKLTFHEIEGFLICDMPGM